MLAINTSDHFLGVHCSISPRVGGRGSTYANITPSERYLELLKEAKIKGYMFQQKNYIPKDAETPVNAPK